MAARARRNTEPEAEAPPPAPPEPPVLPLASVRAPFAQDGAVVRVNGQIILRHVGQVTLLMSNVRKSLSVAQDEVFDDVVAELRGLERPLMRLESAAEFYNAEGQFKKLTEASVGKIRQMNTALGMGLSEEEVASLSGYQTAKRKVLEFFRSLTAGYKLSAKPAGQSELTVSGDKVSNGSRSMSLDQARKVWQRAFKVWSTGEQPATKTMTVRTGEWGDDRQQVTINPASIAVGCQTISRWQAEQLALQQGWLEL
jgi:hypothetical protein